ncbi:MAG: tRNA (adenosine(37)-N6)-dimethylallyltransferase MiaA [Myxococcota bacterium]
MTERPRVANSNDPCTSLIPVVVVTGPTASGKTDLALSLAERFDGEIVNADSMQVYRHMDIGTAKPSPDERARVPHHLFDVVDPDTRYSAGRYAQEARAAARAIHERGRTIFLTGGTGLYIRAFLHGLVATGEANTSLREELEDEQQQGAREGQPQRLHERLAELDPRAAETIHPHDVRRTIRALEIISQSGRSAWAVRQDHSFGQSPFRSLHLAIDPGREEVAARIDERCRKMIDTGLLSEVRALRQRGYGPELRPMQAIGYRHINPVVDGADILSNAVEVMIRDTRRFARRQRTWLRGVDEAIWLAPTEESEVERRVEAFLAAPGHAPD